MEQQNKIGVYAIFDKKANNFDLPFFMPNNAMAVRSFINACKEEKNNLHNFPEDFCLKKVALFNQETGEFEKTKQVTLIEASSVINENK